MLSIRTWKMKNTCITCFPLRTRCAGKIPGRHCTSLRNLLRTEVVQPAENRTADQTVRKRPHGTDERALQCGTISRITVCHEIHKGLTDSGGGRKEREQNNADRPEDAAGQREGFDIEHRKRGEEQRAILPLLTPTPALGCDPTLCCVQHRQDRCGSRLRMRAHPPMRAPHAGAH